MLLKKILIYIFVFLIFINISYSFSHICGYTKDEKTNEPISAYVDSGCPGLNIIKSDPTTGFFEFWGFPCQGYLDFTFSDPLSYYTKTLRVNVEPDADIPLYTIHLNKKSLGILSLFVFDQKGKPVKDGRILIGSTQKRTDSNGYVNLSLTPGNYTIEMRQPGFLIYRGNVSINDSEITYKDIKITSQKSAHL